MHTDAFDFDGDYGRNYEDLARRVIPGYETLFPVLAAVLGPAVPQGGRILVVGAGTGIELATFRRARPDAHLVGVDPSPQMLELAKRRLAEPDAGTTAEATTAEGTTGSVALRLGYVHDLPKRPSFDAATVINVMHFLPDDGEKASLLRGVAQRLRPGGMLALFDLHGQPGSRAHERAMAAWRRYWELMGLERAEIHRFDQRIAAGIHFASARRIGELAREAGFGAPTQFWASLLYGGWTLRLDRGSE